MEKLNEVQREQLLAPWLLSSRVTGLEDAVHAVLKLYAQFCLNVAVTGGTREANARLVRALYEPEEEEGEGEEERKEEHIQTREGESEKVEQENRDRVEERVESENEQHKQYEASLSKGQSDFSPMVLHPHFQNIQIWNLQTLSPSSISPPADGHTQHLQSSSLDLYDMLVVLTTELHQEDHLRLAVELHQKDRPLCLVRAEQEQDVVRSRSAGPCETCARDRLREQYVELQRTSGRAADPWWMLDTYDSFFVHLGNLGLRCKLVELGEVGGVMAAVLPQLKKKAFCRLMVDIATETRIPKLLRYNKRSAISGVLQTEKLCCEDLDQVSKLLQGKVLTGGPAKLLSLLTALEQFQLDVGVLEERSCGSSNLIHALQGLKNQGTDTSQPSSASVGYPHPTLPQVRLWHLPELGQDLDPSYDLYILVCPQRLHQGHMQLLRKVLALDKCCYLVLDQVEEELQEEVRRESEEALGQMGVRQDLFLVSALHPEELDFPRLKQELHNSIPTLRRAAFARYVTKLLEQEVWRANVRDPCVVL